MCILAAKSLIAVFSGPIGISNRLSTDPPLKAGMFLSDEPGYYEDGNFGVRIESIVLVKKVELEVCY